MKLVEFLDQDDLATAYYDPSQDEVSNRVPNDTRKSPSLTLKHLNRLNKVRALDKLKALQREDLFGVMYALPDEAAGGLGGPPF